MKKTLFLASVLCLSGAAVYADDVFVPQSVLRVQAGETVTSATLLTNAAVDYTTSAAAESATVGDVLGQSQQFTKNYSKRSAIVKDGQGTLVVDADTQMKTPLLVREGTLVIKDASVTNTPKSDGNNLSVGGVNAELVLDGGHYSQPMPPAVSYSSSVSVGSIDGDGTLTLKNGSTFSTVQTVFTGGSSNLPMRDAEDPAWNVNPHGGGSYASVDTDPSSAAVIGGGNTYYRYSVNDAGFANPFVTPAGSRLSTATVNVLSGSTLQSGTGFYVYNTTLNIDGEGSAVQTGTRNNSDNLFIGSSYGTTAVVNITNGGKLESFNNQYVCLSYYEGQQTELNISGEGSALTCTFMAYVGAPAGGTTDVRITDGGRMHFDDWYYMRGAAGSHKMLVSGEGSSFEVGSVWQICGADVVIADGAHAQAATWQTVDASRLTLTGGATMSTAKGIMAGGSQTVIEKDSQLSVYRAFVNEGAILINRGTLGHYVDESGARLSDTYLYGGSQLQTGEVLISGCEGLAAEGHDIRTEYNTGLGAYMNLHYGAESDDTDAGTLTVGALLTGKDEMQYLSASDMQHINEAVFSGLALGENESYTIAYKHEVGENVTVNFTTDHLNKVNGTESIAVNGGAVLVEQGQGEHHAGTLGSYAERAGETSATVAVGESVAGSRVTWKGDGMSTVAGETTNLVRGTTVSIGSAEEAGTLTVVADSTLNNNGVIEADTLVEGGGTLKGSGTMGSLVLSAGAELIVGNSPGLQTYTGDVYLAAGSATTFSVTSVMTPATAELHGWESESYSQICLTGDAAFSVADGATFVITLGGDRVLDLARGEDGLSFDLVLVHGGVSQETADLNLLRENTRFCITTEQGGIPTYPVTLHVDSIFYTVENADLVLHGTMYTTPEPATATLSLLALAGLLARRRRK